MSEESQRIADAMDAGRIDLALTWQEIADRAGIGVSSLHRFRNGIGPRTADMTAKVERAYGWPRGSIDAIATGAEAPPVNSEPAPMQPAEQADELSQLEQLAKIAANLEQQVVEMKRQIAAVIHDEQQQRRA